MGRILDAPSNNDDLASAFDISSFFGFEPVNPDVPLSSLAPTVTINEVGDGTLDYFVFEAKAGEVYFLDIDCGFAFGEDPQDPSFDSHVRVLRPDGSEVSTIDRTQDDLFARLGSESNLDAGLNFTAPTSGLYFIEVSAAGSAIPAGADYRLHLGNATEINTVAGTSTNDLLFGSRRTDLLLGLDGNDLIKGRLGNDDLNGGGGNDLLFGQVGNDILNGNDGSDIAKGGRGDDVFIQQLDRTSQDFDWIVGGGGHDTLFLLAPEEADLTRRDFLQASERLNDNLADWGFAFFRLDSNKVFVQGVEEVVIGTLDQALLEDGCDTHLL